MAGKGIAVVIGSKGKVFRFNLNALAALEGAMGLPVQKIDARNFGFKDHRALVWAGLLHDEPKLTLEQAGLLLDQVLPSAKEYGEVIDAALTAFGAAFPDAPKTEEGGADPNVKSATGGETSSS
jgi:hypothetical protein